MLMATLHSLAVFSKFGKKARCSKVYVCTVQGRHEGPGKDLERLIFLVHAGAQHGHMPWILRVGSPRSRTFSAVDAPS